MIDTFFVQIRTPGTAIRNPDAPSVPAWDSDHMATESLLAKLVDYLIDISVALAVYAEASGEFFSLRQRAAAKYQAQFEERGRLPLGAWFETSELAHESRISRIQQRYLGHRRELGARGYVFGLDNIRLGLGVLSRLETAPAGIPSCRSAFDRAFPDVKNLRDSAHHQEDRARYRAKGQPIEPQLLVDPMFVGGTSRGAKVFLAGIDTDDVYRVTGEKGVHASLAVTPQNLEVAQQTVQSVYDAYDWIGLPSVRPYF